MEEERAAKNSSADLIPLLEDLSSRMDRLENQLRDLLDGLARSRPAGRAAPDAAAAASGDTFDGEAGAAPSPVNEARELYEVAYTEVTRGHYDLAITSFQEFLDRYPNDDLADNALYWIGESHYVQREFQAAVDSFVRLLDTYPKGDKVPAALLKLGYAFAEEGDLETSQRYLERLVAEYPTSDEAQKARERMAQR
jgi:tol-pal system protein YbgF